MTNWEFQATCVKHMVSPSIVWESETFRELVNNDNLTLETLENYLQSMQTLYKSINVLSKKQKETKVELKKSIANQTYTCIMKVTKAL